MERHTADQFETEFQAQELLVRARLAEARARELEILAHLAEERAQDLERQVRSAEAAARNADARAEETLRHCYALENQLRRVSIAAQALETRARNAEARAAKFRARARVAKDQSKQVKASLAWKVMWPFRQLTRLIQRLSRGSGKPDQRSASPRAESMLGNPDSAVADACIPIHLSAESRFVYRDLVTAIKKHRKQA